MQNIILKKLFTEFRKLKNNGWRDAIVMKKKAPFKRGSCLLLNSSY